MNQILDNKHGEEPRLWIDFQIMIDSNGQIYHIDLDRYQEYTRKQTKSKSFQRWIVEAMKSNCLKLVKNVMNLIDPS